MTRICHKPCHKVDFNFVTFEQLCDKKSFQQSFCIRMYYHGGQILAILNKSK